MSSKEILSKKAKEIIFINPVLYLPSNMTNIIPNEASKNYNEEKKLDDDAFSDQTINYSENKSIKIIKYINEQIIFFSNLSMTRNSLWKKYLENIFPIKMIFKQINNKKLLKGIF